MTQLRRFLLINPNTSQIITDLLAAEAQDLAGPDVEIDAVTAPFGSAALESPAQLVVAGRAVVEAIVSRDKYDAVIIGALGDPGYERARKIIPAPVYGIGRSGIAAAGRGGRKYAIVTIGSRMRSYVKDMALALGSANSLVEIRFLSGGVLDIARDPRAYTDAVVEAVNDCARNRGAQAVLLGGAPFAGAARRLSDRCVVPVYEGLACAIDDALSADAKIANNRFLPDP